MVSSVMAGGEGFPAVSITGSVQGPAPALFTARTRTRYFVALFTPVLIVVVVAVLVVLACQSVQVAPGVSARYWMS